MSKQLNFEFEGKQYCLEYPRKSVASMEQNGFRASDISDKPMTVLPSLFAGAFLAHHRYLKRDIIDSIFDKMKDKGELIGKLAQMYNEPIEAYMEEPEEAEGNVKWEASW